MKKINIFIIVIALLSIGLSSCWKQAKESDYAPPLSINGYTSANQIATTNLVAHWGFNGDLKDSVSGTAGVNTGTTFSPGLESMALQGSANSYVESAVPAAIQNLHSFTVSLWYNMPENNATVEILGIANPQGFWSNLDIFIDYSPTITTATTGILKVHFFNNGQSATGTDAWFGGYNVNNPFNGWVNVTATYDDTKSAFVIYYNGSSIATATVAGFAPLNWSGVKNMIFGTFPFQATPSLTAGASSQSFAASNTGLTDEVRFYNRVLTSTEVSSLVALQHRGK